MDAKLWQKIYGDPVFTAACRIIGYDGVGPMEFYDAAKLLPNYNLVKFQLAVIALTVSSRREGHMPRYELHHEARRACRQLLGIPPEEPPLRSIAELLGEPPQPESEAKPKGKPRKKAAPKKAPAKRTKKGK